MSLEDEVMKIGKKLEKMISSDTADHSSSLDLLKSLQEKKLNLNVLQKTRIGMTVNNFRKASSNDEVISLAKSLIKNWKKLLPGDNSQSSSKNGETKKPNNSVENSQDSEMTESQDSIEDRTEEKEEESSTQVDITAPETNDPVRIKCRELLANALKVEYYPPFSADCDMKISSNPDDIAGNIEEHIFQEFKNTESKYKSRVRSRIANLKDVRNPKLRENVLCGLIAPERIASMPTEDMANDKMKELRAKYTKESIDDHQMAKTEGTVTDLFKCKKCGKNKCTYNQMQTRSADEPMTTFVFCLECGNRWKFC